MSYVRKRFWKYIAREKFIINRGQSKVILRSLFLNVKGSFNFVENVRLSRGGDICLSEGGKEAEVGRPPMVSSKEMEVLGWRRGLC